VHVCIVIVAAHCTIKSGRDCRRAEASGPTVEEVQGHCCDYCVFVCMCVCVYVCVCACVCELVCMCALSLLLHIAQ